MTFRLDEAIELLERTPRALDALLRGTSQGWHRAAEGPETWSAFDVVGHLIHGEETDWIPRARIILEEGEARPFTPFDRFAQFERFGSATMEELLDRFAALRAESLATLRAWKLDEARLDLAGTHPALGRVTLRQLVATWSIHDLSHIAQISRAMVKRYQGEVGPWREYLSILQRP